jgi:hypothetical protein
MQLESGHHIWTILELSIGRSWKGACRTRNMLEINFGIVRWWFKSQAMNVLLSSMEAEYTIIVSVAEVKAIDLWRCYS